MERFLSALARVPVQDHLVLVLRAAVVPRKGDGGGRVTQAVVRLAGLGFALSADVPRTGDGGGRVTQAVARLARLGVIVGATAVVAVSGIRALVHAHGDLRYRRPVV
ncbi:hypothetical protein ABZU32_32530 [Sphaerisporangium sp. NPDC005288]|uniref:hypothetical protein n=1 Tax=Sphaerisporangium sp. NPDC005288 TaxID=3155114 RepID=UPI0033B6E863